MFTPYALLPYSQELDRREPFMNSSDYTIRTKGILWKINRAPK
jgi:hypothetical protein